MIVHLDTHVASWLQEGDARRLRPVRRVLDRAEIRLSPFAVLELQLLFEIGRIKGTGRWTVESLAEEYDVALSDAPSHEVLSRALDLSFTRDPFDRLIVADALVSGATLLTVDGNLLQHASCARWG